MSDIGLVGVGKIRIEPDFTGFAATFRQRIQPLIKQAALGVNDIDKALARTVATATKLVAPLNKSATSAAKLAESLSAVAAVDMDDSATRLTAALARATPAAADLSKAMTGVRSGFTGAATGAAKLDAALESIDGRDLVNVTRNADAASASLQVMSGAALSTDAALASIDSSDLRAVTVAASQASTALGSTAATAAAAGGTTSGAFTSAANGSSLLRTAVLGTAVAFGGLAVGTGLAVKTAIDFESAWAGVTKTVDGSNEQLATIRQQIIDMAKQVPATTTEIAAVAEAAGALGIATPNVIDFTRVMIDLGNTTDLSADMASDAFARIANITQMPQDQFDELGSTVVDLGNKMAATESEITAMALRIAGAGTTIGLSEDQIVSFAAALSSVGLEAEAGGSAISRTFIDMAGAISEGGDTLSTFARVAGMDAQNFAYLFKTDAAGAVLAFIKGLNQIQTAGGDVFGVLEDLGISEIRQRDALLRAASAGDLFNQALTIGAQAWSENTALANEASKRYGTVASQLEVLKNQALDVARQVGDAVVPSFLNAARAVQQSLVPAFADMTTLVGPSFSNALAAIGNAFAPIVSALGPVLAALADQFTPIVEALTPHLKTFADTIGTSLVTVLNELGPAFTRLVEAAGPSLPVLANLAATVIEKLTPVLVALIDAGLVPLIEAFTNLITPVTENETGMTLLAAAVGLAAAAFAAVQLGGLIAAFAPLASGIATAVAGFTSLNAVVLFFQGAIGAVLGPVTLVVAGIAALGAAFYVAYQHIQPFHDAVDAVGRFIRDTAVAAFERLSDIIGNTLIPFLQRLADVARTTFQENIQPALEKLVGAFTELWDTLVTVGQPVVQWIIDHWQIVAGVLLAVTSPITAVVAGVVALYTQFEPFRDLVNGVVGVLGEFITQLVDIAGPIIGNVIDAVRGLIEIIGGLFSWDIDKIKAGIVTMAEGILGVLRGVFVDLPGVILDALAGLGGLIVDFLADLGPLIVSALSAAWGWVVTQGPVILAALADWLIGLPGTIIGWLGDLGSLLLGWLGSAVTFVVSNEAAVMSGLWDFITSIPQRALDVLSASVSFLLDFVEDALLWLVQDGPDALETVGGFFASLPARILGWIGNLGLLLVDWMTAGFGWVVDNGPGILMAVNGWVSSLPGRFVGLMSNMGSTLVDWLRSAFDFVVEQGPGLIEGVLTFFANLPVRIFDAIRSGIGSAAGAVGDIAKSLYNAVALFLNEKLIGPVKNFTIDFFGPRTPFEALPYLPTFAHTGGIVGRDVGATDGPYPGLASDEVPLVLQRGEGILPRSVMDSLGVDGFARLMSGAYGRHATSANGAAPYTNPAPLAGGAPSPTFIVNVYPTYESGMSEGDAHELGRTEGDAIVEVLRARAVIGAA